MKIPSIGTRAALPALAVVLAAGLAACGGSSKATLGSSSSTTTAGQAGSGTPGSGGPGNGTFNGASGTVAALSGTSMEVQNSSTGQTTVDWTGSTSFIKTASVALSSVSAGDCVTVIGSSSAGTITARSVSITQPSSTGSCTAGAAGGFGGGFAGRPPGSPGGSTPPSSIPSGSVPARRGGGAFAGGSFASGKVVSVGSTSMVINGSTFSGVGRTRSSTSTSTPPTTAAPTNITIALSSSTTYSKTQTTTSSALGVGDCVTATGPADTTGAVTARSVRISSPTNGSCASGFGGFRSGGQSSSTTGQ